jgi:5-methylcytosine-specific restriction endonuclease McrA
VLLSRFPSPSRSRRRSSPGAAGNLGSASRVFDRPARHEAACEAYCARVMVVVVHCLDESLPGPLHCRCNPRFLHVATITSLSAHVFTDSPKLAYLPAGIRGLRLAAARDGCWRRCGGRSRSATLLAHVNPERTAGGRRTTNAWTCCSSCRLAVTARERLSRLPTRASPFRSAPRRTSQPPYESVGTPCHAPRP